jgi:hypothetical protein
MVETENIQLRTSIRRDRAVQLAREMQRTYDVLARFALPCAARRDTDRVPVTVLPGREFTQLRPIAAGFYRSQQVTWLADYDGQIVLPDDLGFVSRQVFQHEVTHRLVVACFASVPTWLNEGLASFFETMFYTGDGVTFGRPPYVFTDERRVRRPTSVLVDFQAVRVVPSDLMPSLDGILAMRTTAQPHQWAERTAAYAASWALVHFLVLGAPDLTPRYEAFLAELRNPGRDARAVFAKAFEGVPLQDRLNEYLRRGKFDMLQSRPSAVIPRSGRINPRVRDMQAEEAHLHLAWMYAGIPDEESRDRLGDHLAAAKQHPRTRRAAYLVAAMAHLMTRDLAAAEREVQEALRDAPDDAALLEAHVDILLAGKPAAAELEAAAERLRRVARTAGQLCSLAKVAQRRGDHKTAVELSARGLQLDPRLLICRVTEGADAPR